jgi:thioredoxin reductase
VVHVAQDFVTSYPVLFAVEAVRSRSMEWVASAVREGSAAVRQVHDDLALVAHPEGLGPS